MKNGVSFALLRNMMYGFKGEHEERIKSHGCVEHGHRKKSN